MKLDLPHWAMWFDTVRAPDGVPVRYRVLYGGRGGGKSWTAATKLVERAVRGPKRILCAREFQVSTRDSSKRLIEDIINRMGLGPAGSGFFEFSEVEIRGRNGSLFSFVGLNGSEAKIKSLEGYDLCWVEEAATISQGSLIALIPTIRNDGSELWFTYNPRQPTDPVDRLFRGEHGPPPGSIVLKVGWRDNRWFNDVLERERAFDEQRDPAKHAHVWEGEYDYHSDALVFPNVLEVDFTTPPGIVSLLGADWGFSKDPAALLHGFVGRWAGEAGKSAVIADPKGDCLFIDEEAYAYQCEIDDLAALFAGYDRHTPPRWSNPRGFRGIKAALVGPIRADSSRPDMISHLTRRSFNIHPSIKGPGSVMEGINFLRMYDIYVHPRCVNTLAELRRYRWKMDQQTGKYLSEPVDKDNHLIDALRYAIEPARRPVEIDQRIYTSGDGCISAELFNGSEDYLINTDPWRLFQRIRARETMRWRIP